MTGQGLKVLGHGLWFWRSGHLRCTNGRAAEVLAIDIDPWSVRNTRENLSLNGMEEKASFDVREGGADQLT